MNKAFASSTVLCALSVLAHGQIVVPSADGSDGQFNPVSTRTIDLRLAAAAAWTTPSAVAGNGVYDVSKWAIVYKYSSVNIPAGVTINFTNHRSRAPVVWLVSGDVTINGSVNLNGQNGAGGAIAQAEPGPGGFRGGRPWSGNTSGSAGFGPGGGRYGVLSMSGAGRFMGSHATVGTGTPGGAATANSPAYGSTLIRPLIGGSGATFFSNGGTFGGGAGGGAILIAAQGTIRINGSIVANGGVGSGPFGSSDGAGGAIRLVADTIGGNASGQLRAIGGSTGAGIGRIRLEYNNREPTFANIQPQEFEVFSVTTAAIWPLDTSPRISIQSVRFLVAPTDPAAELVGNRWDMRMQTNGAFPVVVQTESLNPIGANVQLRVVALNGTDQWTPMQFVSGDTTRATWTANATASALRFSVLQATASVGSQAALGISREVSIYTPQCPADVDDGSGTGTVDDGVGIEDLLYYVQVYGEGSVRADLDDGSTTGQGDGGVTIEDLLYYLARYDAGC